MPFAAYSFIDVAVLDGVRERFAEGDAIVILSSDLIEILWANGPGAALFGETDIEDIVGQPSSLSMASRRQITSIPSFPEIGTDRGVVVRLSNGMRNRAIIFLASAITMPDGEPAIMLVEPAGQSTAPGADLLTAGISGFTQAGHLAAFVDARGRIEAASPGFEALGIASRTFADLIEDLGRGRRRVIKKIIRTPEAGFPAGIARLRDDPARYLAIVVDERQFADDASDSAAVAAPKSASAAPPATAPTVSPTSEPGTISATMPIERDEAGTTGARAQPADETPSELPAAPASHHDEWYFARQKTEERDAASNAGAASGAADPTPTVETAEETISPAFDRAAAPLRFVWKTDAEGRFNSISPEFVRAVGRQAGNVIGMRFRDVADALGLDPYQEISGLLERRDTWSGRSVFWPVAGTDLKVPVDLAALPVYARDRSFEGFRGFGVARMADAVVDSEALGLALGHRDSESASPHDPNGADDGHAEQATQADPFRGEVPALSIAAKPDRRFTDKVIRLAEHRSTGPDRILTTVERSAFREIGEKLRKGSENAPAEDTIPTVPDAAMPLPGDDVKAEPDAAAMRQETAAAPGQSEPDHAGTLIDTSWLEGPAEDDATTGDAAEIASDGPQAAAETNSETPADEQAEDLPADAALDQADEAAREPEAVQPADRTEPEPSPESSWARPAPEPDSPAPVTPPLRPSTAELKTEGFLPSAFSGPSGEVRKPFQDTPILSRLPVPILIHSGDALHYANEEFLALTGYASVDELAEAGGLGALFPETDSLDAGIDDSSDRAIRLLTRDGLEFPIEALLRSVPWNGGKALMLVVRRTGEDDDDRLPLAMAKAPDTARAAPALPSATEELLRARVAEMRTIIDTATDGVILIANDGTIRSISRPAEALFGFESEDVSGKPFFSLFAIESQRSARDYLAGLSDNGVASVLNDGREVIGREAQGRFIPLFMSIGRLPGDSGFCAVVRDITQWKRAEEELTQARALAERASSHKTDFLARVSHEIRTPLNAIIGFSELMVDERFGPIGNDRYRDYLRDINRSGNHVLDLVNDLLDITKIEAGEQEMAYEAVSLNDTLAETVAMMQPQANRERVIIRSSFASRLPEVVADLRSVRQIALNVLSNAVRYTQAGGQVIVSTSYELSGDVVMRVRDTGIGMSQAEIEQAMKPFKQINALKRGRGDGTGLGLPLTKAMVEANRARFSINSTPGEGTLVEVTFPSTRVLAG